MHMLILQLAQYILSKPVSCTTDCGAIMTGRAQAQAGNEPLLRRTKIRLAQ
jgi:hypothetical protein